MCVYYMYAQNVQRILKVDPHDPCRSESYSKRTYNKLQILLRNEKQIY